jgi:hypothetical protein
MRWLSETFRLTVLLLWAAALLVLAGTAGLGGGPFVTTVLALVAGATYLAREPLDVDAIVIGHHVGWYTRALWVGGLVAVSVSIVGLGATPGELQALGGITGLVGMTNYFLRPVYLFVADLTT